MGEKVRGQFVDIEQYQPSLSGWYLIAYVSVLRLKVVVPKVRVELTRGCPHRFLRPARLPFRHFGTKVIL